MSEGELYVTGMRASTLNAGAWRVAGVLSWLLAAAILALVIAHWAWKWVGPAPVSIPIVISDADVLRRVADARLFGVAAPSATVGSGTAGNVGDLRLLGIFALRDGGGYAVFRTARGPLIASAGQDIAAGVKLDSIRPDGVTLVDAGVRREIALRAATAAEARPAVASTQGSKPSACAVPAGFSGPIVRLNAELLGGMTSTPDAWKAFLEAGSGGLIVRDQSGFAGMLGLKNGDRIERANGVALAIPSDIALTVLQPLTRSQSVWVAGTREGKPQHWLYINTGACPA